jgi:hypothetical protein
VDACEHTLTDCSSGTKLKSADNVQKSSQCIDGESNATVASTVGVGFVSGVGGSGQHPSFAQLPLQPLHLVNDDALEFVLNLAGYSPFGTGVIPPYSLNGDVNACTVPIASTISSGSGHKLFLDELLLSVHALLKKTSEEKQVKMMK